MAHLVFIKLRSLTADSIRVNGTSQLKKQMEIRARNMLFFSNYWSKASSSALFFKALHMALLLKGMQYFCPWYWQQGGEREKDVKDDIYCSVQIALGKVWPQIGTLLTNTKMYLRDNWGKTKLIFWSIWFFKKVLIAHEQSATFDISSSFWKASAWKGSCTIFLQIFYQLSFDI